MVTRRRNPLLWLVAAFAVFAGALWQQRAENAPATAPQPSGPSAKWARVQQVIPAGERDAVLKTLATIERGGPFAHQKDGSVFSNREGRLPAQGQGYYREYTVPTPGASDRGARRVVQGRNGDTWYTSDHYRTFVRIDA